MSHKFRVNFASEEKVSKRWRPGRADAPVLQITLCNQEAASTLRCGIANTGFPAAPTGFGALDLLGCVQGHLTPPWTNGFCKELFAVCRRPANCAANRV
jgi:hypothetical protein